MCNQNCTNCAYFQESREWGEEGMEYIYECTFSYPYELFVKYPETKICENYEAVD